MDQPEAVTETVNPYAEFTDRELLERIAQQNDAFIALATNAVETAGPMIGQLTEFMNSPKGKLMSKLIPGFGG